MAAFICYNEDGCKKCSFYRLEDGQRAACFIKQDMTNVSKIVLETWELNQAEAKKYGEAKIRDFNIWISYIMCYGYDPAKIYDYAKAHNIAVDMYDCDPDDPDDHYGALLINEDVINLLREEVRK